MTLYRQEGSKRIALTPAEEAEVRAEWATNEAAAQAEQDRQRRIALAEHHDRRARYVRAATITSEDYTDLIGEEDTEIMKLTSRRTTA